MYRQPELNLIPDEVLVYLRKSRSDDPLLSVEEVLSKHETILDNWAKLHFGAAVPEENKHREIVSGETIDERIEMKALLSRMESPRIKAVLVVEPQRLSRGDLEDAGRLIKLLRYTNTIVITPPKTYDLRDEYDRDAFERELKRGNEFLEYQKKIMNRGRLLSVQQGNFIGSIPPYGYDRTVVIDGKRKCPTLKINEQQAEVVKLIFDLYVNQDMGRTNIAHRLDNLGIKPPRGNYWSPAALKDMLENVHYIGKIKWNFRKIVKVVEDGDVVKTRPKSKIEDFLMFDGRHDAIISEELFYAAQEKQGRNHRAKPATKVRNPFAGLLYCQCGRAMSLRTYKKNGIERSAPRMLCDNQSNCKTSSCLYEDVERLVSGILEDYIKDFEILIQNDNKESERLHANLIQQLEKKLVDLRKKEISQWEKYSEEGMPKHIFEQLNEKVLQEMDETKQALANAKKTVPASIDYQEKLVRLKAALHALKDPKLPAEAKNKLLKSCIEKIEYRREKAFRITKETAGDKDALSVGGAWTAPKIDLDVELRL